MGKRTLHPTCTGRLAGTQVEISDVHNDALCEYVTIVNRGTLAQPMGRWALATLRGERFYFFPDALILLPGMTVSIHSGHTAPDTRHGPGDLFWAREQMWNNRGDVAVLFDASGVEVDRYAYPHERILGCANRRRKRLLHDGETWRIVDEPTRQQRRSQKGFAVKPERKSDLSPGKPRSKSHRGQTA